MCERKEENAFWQIDQGVQFPVAELLINSINSALNEVLPEGERWQDGKIQPVIVIPETLHENGQDALLSRCSTLGLPSPFLLWRSVAAALTWISQLSNEQRHQLPLNKDCAVAVLYFGADAIEMTLLRLRGRSHKGHNLILPLRRRPTNLSLLPAGMDWAANIMEQLCDKDDYNAFWQLFTRFPEVWQTIAGAAYQRKEFPRVWSTANGWKLWTADSIANKVMTAPACHSQMLHNLFAPSCHLIEYNEGRLSYVDWLKTRVAKFVDEVSADGIHLVDIITCGSLISSTPCAWLKEVCAPFARLKTSIGTPLFRSCFAGHKALAQGATIYGEYRRQGIPAYLDTVEQISLLTRDGSGYRQWSPLLKTLEVVGGEKLKGDIPHCVSVRAKSPAIDLWLCMGDTPDLDDRFPKEPVNVSSCRLRLIRQWVRQQDSLAQVIEGAKDLPEKAYVIAYARVVFGFDEKVHETIPAKGQENVRRYRMTFPRIPEHNMLLDVELSIYPASGRAQIYFVPTDKEFLDGRKIRLNYDRMEKNIPLDREEHGWPARMEIAAHPDDISLTSRKNILKRWEHISPQAWLNAKETKNIWQTLQLKKMQYNGHLSVVDLSTITEDGECCTEAGRAIVARIANRFRELFDILVVSNPSEIGPLLVRATRLNTATPANIRAFIVDCLNKRQTAGLSNFFDAAGRCLSSKEELSAFINCILADKKYTISYLRGLRNILQYRTEVLECLDENSVFYILMRVKDSMKKEYDKKTFKQTFFQCSLVILYLLRYRMRQPDFFEQPHVKQILDCCIKYMHDASESLDKQDSNRQKYLTAAKTFEDFVNKKAVGLLPLAIAELSEE
ncbi:MAG: hypothetical protein IJU76_13740 [Desulfovibrionaceae bacterium]|nr:hypothetical protein [Desulfovibrionaceae bacterium]